MLPSAETLPALSGVDDPAAPEENPTLDGMRKALAFLAQRVLERHDGRPQDATFIACRTVIIAKLFGTDDRSIRDWAHTLGVAPSGLSKIGRQFSAQLGMQARWQRVRRAPVGAPSAHLRRSA